MWKVYQTGDDSIFAPRVRYVTRAKINTPMITGAFCERAAAEVSDPPTGNSCETNPKVDVRIYHPFNYIV